MGAKTKERDGKRSSRWRERRNRYWRCLSREFRCTDVVRNLDWFCHHQTMSVFQEHRVNRQAHGCSYTPMVPLVTHNILTQMIHRSERCVARASRTRSRTSTRGFRARTGVSWSARFRIKRARGRKTTFSAYTASKRSTLSSPRTSTRPIRSRRRCSGPRGQPRPCRCVFDFVRSIHLFVLPASRIDLVA